ncbi:MAG: hypothetical protein PHE82_01300, partial [Syntrophomonadaceae bacterium]|nr:hypothetical protein [Syntrophomonadaceae bacterium]
MAGVDVSLGQLRDYFKGIYDAIATGGAAKKNTGLQIAGTDGTNAQIIRTNANGEALVQLSGSNVQESQAIPTKNSYKDIAMRAYDNIINKVGAENIQCLLPMWETGGTIVKDLLRGNDIQFDIIGATLNQPSTPNYGLKFDGVNDYAIFKAEVETTVQDGLISLDGASKKFAQKLSPKTSLSVGMINLWLQKTGT